MDGCIMITKIANKIFGVKGRLINVNFKVCERKTFTAFVPDDQLFGAIKDILLNREYEYLSEFELNNFKQKRVVDAGAHVGLYSLIASVFAREVIAIEPHPTNFKLLRLNLKMNNVENVIAINKAVWSKSDSLFFYEGTHTGAHSTINFQKFGDKKFMICSLSLNEIIEKFGKINLLKMDIEGSEFEVLGKIKEVETFKNIENIAVECHLKIGDVNKLERYLKRNGYRIEKFSPPLFKEKAGYSVHVTDLTRLKMFKKILYAFLSLAGYRDNTLAILFASRIR